MHYTTLVVGVIIQTLTVEGHNYGHLKKMKTQLPMGCCQDFIAFPHFSWPELRCLVTRMSADVL